MVSLDRATDSAGPAGARGAWPSCTGRDVSSGPGAAARAERRPTRRPDRDRHRCRALRALTDDEYAHLGQLGGDPGPGAARPRADAVRARAQALLAVRHGATCAGAARVAGWRCGTAVARLVVRFNAEGMAALTPRHGGGRRPTYSDRDRAQILDAVHRLTVHAGPRRWSVATVQRVLRESGEARLHDVSHPIVRHVLREAGLQWTRAHGWALATSRSPANIVRRDGRSTAATGCPTSPTAGP